MKDPYCLSDEDIERRAFLKDSVQQEGTRERFMKGFDPWAIKSIYRNIRDHVWYWIGCHSAYQRRHWPIYLCRKLYQKFYGEEGL